MSHATPLAEKLRPHSLNEVVGQHKHLKKGSFLYKIISEKKPLSLLLFGPPGCGKTTLARIYAQALSENYLYFSAVFGSIAAIKKELEQVDKHPLFNRKQLIVFVDEIHRFNKAQQDAFLPYLEKGLITLIGTTTENPSFCLNGALLSRLRVIDFTPLDKSDLEQILNKFLQLHSDYSFSKKVKDYLVEEAKGDGRYLLNLLENLSNSSEKSFQDIESTSHWLQRRFANYDQKGDSHYELISALHKAVRGSDPQASLYWLSRMLEAGADPLYILRRLSRIASEDIGLADPQALQQCISAKEAFLHLGSPEGLLPIAQACTYLALAPKSNAVYTAFKESIELAKKTAQHAPPPHIVNAPTKLMKEMGLGKGYIYDQDSPYKFSGQNFMPQQIPQPSFYKPSPYGFEKELKKRMDFFDELKKKLQKKS
ncbi:MAG: replication-associated recombination protein A [Chlamydiales bacterium]|nr:replication-associated recombination protein A [Chlamydiales bacterium]